MRVFVLVAATIAALPAMTVEANAFNSTHCGISDPDPINTVSQQILGYNSALAQHIAPSEDKACYYYGRGLLYHLEKNYDRAIADYTKAIGYMSEFGEVHASLADAYDAAGQLDKAQAEYAEARRLDRDDVWALNDRCWQRAIRGTHLDLAAADCDRALEITGTEYQIWDSQCLVDYRRSNYADAISDCDRALKLWQDAVYEVKMDSSLRAGSFYVRGLAKIKNGDEKGGDADIAAAKDNYRRVAEKYALFGVMR